MRTSLTDIQQTEKYIKGEMSAGDALVFEARLITSPLLRTNMFFQQKCYALLQLYNRKKIKEAAETVHNRLFTDPGKADFQQCINQLFNK